MHDTLQAAQIDALREGDKDRYLTALFAPVDRRAQLISLYLFNLELARIPGRINEPIAGLIRLQWWRDGLDDAVAGKTVKLPILVSLGEALARGWLQTNELISLIDAREREFDGEGFARSDRVIEHARATGGRVQALAAKLLGADETETMTLAEDIGTAMTITSVVAAMTVRAEPSAKATIDELTNHASGLLQPCRPPRSALAAFLPALIVKRDLKALHKGDYRHVRSPWLPIQLFIAHTIGAV